jgi:predicted RNase H-like HicB family nuclease
MKKDKYTYLIEGNEDGYAGRVLEFPSIEATGRDPISVLKDIKHMTSVHVKGLKEAGEFIPTPLCEKKCSGKFLVRTTKSLHRELVTQAAIEGVSLNKYVNSLLAN